MTEEPLNGQTEPTTAEQWRQPTIRPDLSRDVGSSPCLPDCLSEDRRYQDPHGALDAILSWSCRSPAAWGHWESGFASIMGPPRGEFRQQDGATFSPVMGPPRSIHQRRRR
jgi:hypothetical protein